MSDSGRINFEPESEFDLKWNELAAIMYPKIPEGETISGLHNGYRCRTCGKVSRTRYDLSGAEHEESCTTKWLFGILEEIKKQCRE